MVRKINALEALDIRQEQKRIMAELDGMLTRRAAVCKRQAATIKFWRKALARLEARI